LKADDKTLFLLAIPISVWKDEEFN